MLIRIRTGARLVASEPLAVAESGFVLCRVVGDLAFGVREEAAVTQVAPRRQLRTPLLRPAAAELGACWAARSTCREASAKASRAMTGEGAAPAELLPVAELPVQAEDAAPALALQAEESRRGGVPPPPPPPPPRAPAASLVDSTFHGPLFLKPSDIVILSRVRIWLMQSNTNVYFILAL